MERCRSQVVHAAKLEAAVNRARRSAEKVGTWMESLGFGG